TKNNKKEKAKISSIKNKVGGITMAGLACLVGIISYQALKYSWL
ncbi:MAG: hypothetical protein ACI9IJ_002048, partial [Psychromonas sp.]